MENNDMIYNLIEETQRMTRDNTWRSPGEGSGEEYLDEDSSYTTLADVSQTQDQTLSTDDIDNAMVRTGSQSHHMPANYDTPDPSNSNLLHHGNLGGTQATTLQDSGITTEEPQQSADGNVR